MAPAAIPQGSLTGLPTRLPQRKGLGNIPSRFPFHCRDAIWIRLDHKE